MNTGHVKFTNASIIEAYLEDALELLDKERKSPLSLAKTVEAF